MNFILLSDRANDENWHEIFKYIVMLYKSQ